MAFDMVNEINFLKCFKLSFLYVLYFMLFDQWQKGGENYMIYEYERGRMTHERKWHMKENDTWKFDLIHKKEKNS